MSGIALMRRLVIIGMVSLVFLAGCGGGSYSGTSQIVTVAITPLSTNVLQGGTANFIATVTGSSNTGVTWSVREGAAGGAITAAGIYSAPNAAGAFHVVATSQADSSKSATATVIVPALTILVQPKSVSMTSGESTTFTAQVTGTVKTGVTWSVQEASGGQITSLGTYTAPAQFGVFHVVATSQADSSQTDMSTVTVAAVTVTVSPTNDVLGPGGVRQFSAATSAINQAVTWVVQEGAAGGTITTKGLYTAPSQVGDFHVVATSVVDPSKSATAAMTAVAAGFRPTGGMGTGRSAHSATVLQGGKVLIAGGDACFFSNYFYYYASSCVLKSAEIYDPTSGTFSGVASNMSAARDFHTATLLPDGRVLLAGGGVSSAELYDPTSGTFKLTGSMSVPRSGHTATLLSTGKVLIVGGSSLTGKVSSAELFDPAAGTFAVTGSLAEARSAHSATLLSNGKVLVAGGTQPNGSALTAELYDPASGMFSATGVMGTARVNHTATLMNNGKVLIAGGSVNGNALNSAELYDIASGTFSATGTMVMKRDSHVAVLLGNGSVLVAGGSVGDFTAELYDPVAGTFTQTGSMATGRSLGAVVLLGDGRVLVVGGSDSPSADIYK